MNLLKRTFELQPVPIKVNSHSQNTKDKYLALVSERESGMMSDFEFSIKVTQFLPTRARIRRLI